MHRRSLRVRLLAIVLAGIAIIAAVEALIGNWGLTNVRDVAITATAGLDAHGDTIAELLGAALVAAHGGRLERRDDGLAITLPTVS